MTTLIYDLELKIDKNRVKSRLIDLVAYASDAGFYTLRPIVVVQPKDEEEIKYIFNLSNKYSIPVVFRTGGTSLSGQSITDGILIDLSQHWRKISVENNGELVRVQPGVIGVTANVHLKKYQRKIGPDPSSIGSAMMGGILSNNSSGMCCGVSLNSYHTVKYIRFILLNGESFSTEIKDDYDRFEKTNIAIKLTILYQKIHQNPTLVSKIRDKYLTKNTVGYSLNAFLDYKHPLDIFAHLLIGGEGTLAFIAEAVLQTVPDLGFKATGILYFDDIFSACSMIKPLSVSGAAMIELMDRASLRSVENVKGIPPEIKELSNTSAALLVEYQADSEDSLNFLLNQVKTNNEYINNTILNFSRDYKQQAFYWKIRKGMFPAVGAVRASGTTVILEDVAFPVEKLGKAILDLQLLFAKYKYENAIIFGHAKDGNIHFVVTQSFEGSAEIARYEAFMNEVVTLVVSKYNGALKAEHGTGRNMAPFVETEWGAEAYSIMKDLKSTLDSENLLNPGVIINEDSKVHLKNLKNLPTVESEVDKCIECGACEPKCPSRDLTITPRRRIQVRRELATLKNTNIKEYNSILADYQYDGLETCAVDGLCATDCPVDINTGELVKRLRKESHSDFSNRVATFISKNFYATENILRFAIFNASFINTIFGKNAMLNLTKTIKKVIPEFPLWSNQLVLNRAYSLKNCIKSEQKVVYFSACINRIMGNVQGNSIQESFYNICKKSNIEIITPATLKGNCCGQPFSSKGYKDAFYEQANHTIKILHDLSENGKIKIMLDLSSCTQTLMNCKSALSDANKIKFENLTFVDISDFIYKEAIPNLKIKDKKKSITLHPVCSLQKMGNYDNFTKLAQQCAENVVIPMSAGCCGMAGDRGFIFPELTKSATENEAKEVSKCQTEGYYSSSKTCEIALSEATNQNYQSLVQLVDEVSV